MIQADFQNCHTWAWNLAIGKSSRSCTYILFLNWVQLCSTGSGFRYTGWFSKLPYLRMKLGYWQKIQMLHILLSSYPRGSTFSWFLLYGQRSPVWFSKLPYLAMKLGQWPKFQRVKIEPIFVLRAAGLSQGTFRKSLVEKELLKNCHWSSVLKCSLP